MDDKWRTIGCPSCTGGQVFCDGCGADECRECGGSGRLWIRPSGHTFAYPGGPAAGMWDKAAYGRARPEPAEVAA